MVTNQCGLAFDAVTEKLQKVTVVTKMGVIILPSQIFVVGLGMGRPTDYTEEAADAICAMIATTNLSMKSICEQLGYPTGTVLAWLSREPTFQEKYARAKDMQADLLAEEILDIADDGSNDFMTIVKGDREYEVENKEVTNRSRLRIDSRKWLAGKLRPKKYGDKVMQEITGADGGPFVITGMNIT